ncbi:RNA polymerase sigma factor SigM [Streptacidiphilus sp. P02-A3a]|uniref:RNA polymerase sigma factor SigM n=1 Tax=Streptacidiphilus sp. P02-A3a TaxID=2704468 RepID=UPI0015FE7CDE|nr:RNA polymerase sigma factor SigM [Streptacidiphilus sp. P02-A3a]QMU73481.1 RNA polymerase sigma factor SigM [Streptacidiphilus sp. P02-A3a]
MQGTAGGEGQDRPADSDSELLARHVAGDHEAFGVLVARHRDRLWAVALRTLGDREEAADALQDALVSAFRGAHTFQGRSAVTTWLHRIVVNACLDRARRAASHPTRPLDEQPAVEALLGHGEGADAPVERGELRKELATALAALPQEQRAALVLVDMHGYPVAEAAAILGVPTGTVKSRCARGRARLLPRIAHLRSAAVSRETTASPEATAARTTAVSRETPVSGSGAPPPPRNPEGGASVPLLAAPPVKDSRAGGEAAP